MMILIMAIAIHYFYFILARRFRNKLPEVLDFTRNGLFERKGKDAVR